MPGKVVPHKVLQPRTAVAHADLTPYGEGWQKDPAEKAKLAVAYADALVGELAPKSDPSARAA